MGLIKKQVVAQPEVIPVVDYETKAIIGEAKVVNIPAEKVEYVKNGYGKPMSAYEVLLDKRISAAGVVQSVGGQVYAAIAMGLPAEKADAFVEEKSRLMLDLINRIAEGK